MHLLDNGISFVVHKIISNVSWNILWNIFHLRNSGQVFELQLSHQTIF